MVNHLVSGGQNLYFSWFGGLHGKHTILCCMILPRNRRIYLNLFAFRSGGMDEQIPWERWMGLKDAAFPPIDSNDIFKNGRLFYIFYLMLHDQRTFWNKTKQRLTVRIWPFSWPTWVSKPKKRDVCLPFQLTKTHNALTCTCPLPVSNSTSLLETVLGFSP